MGFSVRQIDDPVSSEENSAILCHYGVLGMKWGVRRTSEQLGHRTKPTFSEERQVRKLKGAYKASTKNAVKRAKIVDEDQKNVKKADKAYERQQKKGFGIRPSTKKKRIKELKIAESVLNRKMDTLSKSETNREKAMDIMEDRKKDLQRYVQSLSEKYGIENVKQLSVRSKPVKAGKDYVIENVYKTGLRVQDLPLIGKRISGKQVAQWERDKRYEALEDEVRENKKKR